MRGKVIAIVFLMTLSAALLWLATFMVPITTAAASSKDDIFISLSPTASPSISTQSAPAQQAHSIDPAILAALIGLVGVIMGAVITGAIAIHQSKIAAQIEKQRREEQWQHEEQLCEEQQRHEEQLHKEQQQHEEQLREEQRQYEEHLLLLQKELERQFNERKKIEQQEARKSEVLRMKMLQNQTNSERAKTYRQALAEDPRISRIQILDMSYPLVLANIYVRVRVHQDTRVKYEIDSGMRTAENKRDPNALLQASQKSLEQRISSALDPSEAVHSYKHCIILGDPGAGKSTLLKYLTLQAAAGRLSGLPDLPILVELNVFASSDYHNLLDFISATWEERYGFPKSAALSFIEEKLYEGDAFLLLDALDETVIGSNATDAEASYQRVVDSIVRIATRYYQSPIVVTARKAGYHQRIPLQGFTELEVLDFRPEDIYQFVVNWFGNSPTPQKRSYAVDLNTKLEQNPRMLALAANPLLLSIIVLVYETQLDLPDRRTELYRRCVDVLLTEWDAKRYIRRRREFRPEHKRQLLAEIAWHFHSQGRRYFPESELLSVIARFLQKINLPPEQSEQILAEIANEQGLLKEQAKGWHGFLHLTLQEYFVALYIAEHQQVEVLLSYCGDPWWEEVLLLYAGHAPDTSALLRKLLGYQNEQLQEDIFQTKLILAGRCLAARPTIQDISLWEITIDQMFRVLTTTPYSLIQEHITGALIAMDNSKVNERLQQLLFESQLNITVRESIAEALGRAVENPTSLEQLLTNKQLDLNIILRIAEGLGNSSKRHILLRFLSNRNINANVQRVTATSLGRTGEQVALQLLSDPTLGASIRSSIAEGLGDSGERQLAPSLLQLLSPPYLDPLIRGSIALALGRLGERSIAPDLLNLLANPQITMPVRGYITLALYQLGERKLGHEISRLLSTQQFDSDKRRYIAESLGRAGEQIALQLLSDPILGASIRSSIAEGLGDSGERQLAPSLLQLLSTPHLDLLIRGSIALALGRLGERSIAPDLLNLLANPQIEAFVRIRIADSLGGLGEVTIVPDLMELFSRTASVLVRTHIAWSLVRLGEQSMIAQLVQLLSDPQIGREKRKNITRSIEHLKKSDIAEQDLLSDATQLEDMLSSITQNLSKLEDQTLIQELLQFLSNMQIDRSIRIRTMRMLEHFVSDETIVQSLLAILPTSDIADQIHRGLWSICRRTGIKIILTPEGGMQTVKW